MATGPHISTLSAQMLGLDKPFETRSFLLWFLLLHLLKQSLKAPGPHVSALSTKILGLDEPFKTRSFLIWFLSILHLLKNRT